ncbi:MAG: polysaccharide biosynthesis/export family protein [Planctomycetota bacterium]|nr:polysaccharide biosynthesis/export family protein [Planctomycetota bacterium]
MARIATVSIRRHQFVPATTARLAVCVAVLSMLGCSIANFNAESMPNSMRVTARSNPQEVDLTRLAAQSVSNELIANGDVLEVTIAAGLSEDDTFTIPVRVNENDGMGSMPVIGRVPLAGKRWNEAEAIIYEQCVQQGLYKSPHITVTMKKQRVNRVRVIGAVVEPNTYELPRQHSDLVAAITAAKGLAENAGEFIEIRYPTTDGGATIDRSSPRIAGGHAVDSPSIQQVSANAVIQPAAHMKSVRINMVSAAKSGANGYNVPDGAVVFVERRDPPPVTVMGLVKHPGPLKYPIGKDLRVLDAVSMAGGRSLSMADKIYIIRARPDSTKSDVINVSIRTAKGSLKSNVLLKPGDTVSVEHTPITMLAEWIQILRFGIGTSVGLF